MPKNNEPDSTVNSKLPSHLQGQIQMLPNQLHSLLNSNEFRWVEEQLLLHCNQILQTVSQGPVTQETSAAYNFLLGKRKGLLEFRDHLFQCLEAFSEDNK